MSYATVSYTGNGSNQNFNIPFPYIDRSDIVVTVGGVVRVLDTHYSFSNSTTINILTAPGAGVPVQIKRETNINTVAVEFSDKAILTSEALNTNAEQTLYVSQELYDATEDIVGAVDAANTAASVAESAAITANNAAATANAAAATIGDKANSGDNSDITSLASPALGAATATTQAANDNSTKVATTAYADRLKIATQVAPGTSGRVLTSNGSAWVSAALPATPVAAIRQVVTAEVPYATGSTTIPWDNTIPTNAEGTQVVSASITPAATANKVRVRGTFLASYVERYSPSTPYGVIVAVFRGSTCIGTAFTGSAASGDTATRTYNMLSFEFMDTPNTTSSTTYSVRVGRAYESDGWTVGQESSTHLGDTTDNNIISLEEISV